jgi:small subunit ribosomal protein S2e
MKIMPVQKQTRAGQRTRFKAFVVVGDSVYISYFTFFHSFLPLEFCLLTPKDGHVGLGVKCSKEVATAIRGAILNAKVSLVPIRRGYWGNKIGKPHTVPEKVHGKAGSVRVRIIPAPRGTGIVAGPVPKKILQYAGVTDAYTQSQGSTATLGNFAKATFVAVSKTYAFLTPDVWPVYEFTKSPFSEHALFLAEAQEKDAKTY